MSLKTTAKLKVPGGAVVQVIFGEAPVPKSLPSQVFAFGISPQAVKASLVTVNAGSPFTCDAISVHTLFGVKTGGSGRTHAPAEPPLPADAVVPAAPALPPEAVVPPVV